MNKKKSTRVWTTHSKKNGKPANQQRQNDMKRNLSSCDSSHNKRKQIAAETMKMHIENTKKANHYGLETYQVANTNTASREKKPTSSRKEKNVARNMCAVQFASFNYFHTIYLHFTFICELLLVLFFRVCFVCFDYRFVLAALLLLYSSLRVLCCFCFFLLSFSRRSLSV